eukprot:COSAG01_NODE_880_length_12937_cov_265.873968_1_plen_112_part_00
MAAGTTGRVICDLARLFAIYGANRLRVPLPLPMIRTQPASFPAGGHGATHLAAQPVDAFLQPLACADQPLYQEPKMKTRPEDDIDAARQGFKKIKWLIQIQAQGQNQAAHM